MSDLHIRETDTYNEKKMRDALPGYLRKIGPVDALFLTGDFRYAKESQGNPKAIAQYIKGLAETLNVKNIICVPGNHDLNRDDIRTALIEANIKNYNVKNGQFSDQFISHFKSGFSFFDQLGEELGDQISVENSNDIHFVKHLDKVDILLLNTAFAAGRSDERGTLLLGAQYVNKAIKQLRKQTPVIALGHHGSSFLDAEEFKQISMTLNEHKVSLYLCGHEHALWHETCGQNLHQVTAGCIYDDNGKINVGFTTGTLDDNNAVTIQFHQWDSDHGVWQYLEDTLGSFFIGPYERGQKKADPPPQKTNFVLPPEFIAIPRKQYTFALNGHTLIGGRGRDGIKYYWKKNGDKVESVAFNHRLCEPDPKHEADDMNISAYTLSTSFGCVLTASNQQCRFCETGSRTFKGFLSAEEIAMQAIFMANYDADCLSFPEVRNHRREFAFMGQGEPGLNYPAVRESIRLIDRAMEEIGQTVHRYIISSCGITTFIPGLIEDIRRETFKNKVSLHFSLHGIGKARTELMPIETEYGYQDFIHCCEDFFRVEKEMFGVADKIGVGLLMFKKFVPSVRAGEVAPQSTTLDTKQLTLILKELDPEVFRIDLSDFNHTSVTEQSEEISNEEAHELLTCAESMGFEAKIFSSFGRDRHSGCGMLKSEYLDVSPDGETTLKKYNESLDLLHYALHLSDKK